MDTRKQNIEVEIPGRKEKQIFVFNDTVLVDITVVEDAIRTDKSCWTLEYSSSQGLTISDTIVRERDQREKDRVAKRVLMELENKTEREK